MTNTETEITYGNLESSVTLSGTIELPAGWSPLHRAQFSPQHLAAQAGLAEDGGGFDPPLVDVTVVPFFNNAPRVTNVFVNGTRWSDDFRAKLADLGVGDARFGYAIPGATPSALDRTQLDTLPWLDLDELSIRFNKPVNVQSADLQLASSTPIEIAGFELRPFNSHRDLVIAGRYRQQQCVGGAGRRSPVV